MIPDHALSDICGPGLPLLARTPGGGLMIDNGRGWEPFDFNDCYRNDYPACIFTALTYAGHEFYLAGLDQDGRPHLFTSLLGTVWEMRNLTASHPLLGSQRVTGEIVRILFDGIQNQVFLVCSNGQLVTLSDCPKCIRIRQVCEQGLTGGRIDGDQLVLLTSDNRDFQLPVSEATYFRVALSFMQNQLTGDNGLVVDLRSSAEFSGGSLPGSINIGMDDLQDWLSMQVKDQTVFFICRVGLLADEAAHLARQRGFGKAYSLGGIRFLASVL